MKERIMYTGSIAVMDAIKNGTYCVMSALTGEISLCPNWVSAYRYALYLKKYFGGPIQVVRNVVDESGRGYVVIREFNEPVSKYYSEGFDISGTGELDYE